MTADHADRVATGEIGAIVGTAAIVRPAARVKTRMWERCDGYRAPSPLFPPSQVVPIFGRQRAENRLQGHASVVALHLRTRQDRAVAHHRGERRQAARARPGDQARPVPGPFALCDPLKAAGRVAALEVSEPTAFGRGGSWRRAAGPPSNRKPTRDSA